MSVLFPSSPLCRIVYLPGDIIAAPSVSIPSRRRLIRILFYGSFIGSEMHLRILKRCLSPRK